MRLPNSPESIAESLKAGAERIRNTTHAGQPLEPLYFLLQHAAAWIKQDAEARARDLERIRELERQVVSLGGGFDRRGLDGDPKEPRPVPQVLKQGSWVDEGSHA